MRGSPRAATAVAAGMLCLAYLAVLSPAASAAKKTPKCFGQEATIVGTNGDDDITGTRKADVIVTKRGDDVVDGRGGGDMICTGGGDDIVFSGPGPDSVKLGPGFLDRVFPGPGNDFVNGGPGFLDHIQFDGFPRDLTVNLGTGVATGQGRDTFRGIEAVHGGEGDDALTGSDHPEEELEGFGGNDTIRGHGGFDFIVAGMGDDDVDGGEDFDILDHYFATDPMLPSPGPVQVDLAAGTVTGAQGTDTIAGIEEVGGTAFDDTLTGDEFPNFLHGFDGNDTIHGGASFSGELLDEMVDDVITTGAGDDTVDGGPGPDVVDQDFYSPLEFPPAGVDVDLAAGTSTGQGNDTYSGIEFAAGTFDHDDVLRGTDEANILIGYGGGDTLEGRGGDDLLDGDVFLFGFPENLPGDDDLDGGDGTDTCLGGESVANCEVTAGPAHPAFRMMRTTMDAGGRYTHPYAHR